MRGSYRGLGRLLGDPAATCYRERVPLALKSPLSAFGARSCIQSFMAETGADYFRRTRTPARLAKSASASSTSPVRDQPLRTSLALGSSAVTIVG